MAKKKTLAQKGGDLFLRGAKTWLKRVGMRRVPGGFYPYRLMTTLGTLKIDVLDEAADGSVGFTMKFLDDEAARRALRKDRFFNNDTGIWIMTWVFKDENIDAMTKPFVDFKKRIIPLLPRKQVLVLADFNGTIHGAVMTPPEFNQATLAIVQTAARRCYNQQIVAVDIDIDGAADDADAVVHWIESKNGR